jgi:uncharacterized protein YjbI with pentapeptide repeats
MIEEISRPWLTIKNRIIKEWRNSIHDNWILKYRKSWLSISVVLGIFLVYLFLNYPFLNIENERITSGIFFILLAFPISSLLWFFRNHDVLEQIEQTRENNNFNNFSNAMKLFLEKNDKKASAVGLTMLAEIRRENLFVNQIDSATRNSNLMEIDLSGAYLGGLNLSNANLGNANLGNANLRGADLSNANLRGADLSKANLFNIVLFDANLINANLSGADLSYACLSDAKLINADLINANLNSANLSGANLLSAKLINANLSGADLSRAILDKKALVATVLCINKKNITKIFSNNDSLIDFIKNETNSDFKIKVRVLKNEDGNYYFEEMKQKD